MAWPSKNPDDYVNQPVFSPAIPGTEKAAIDKLDPADWRLGAVPDKGIGSWMLGSLGLTYGASVLAGYDIVESHTTSYFSLPGIVLAFYLARRAAAARLITSPWPPSVRFAPVGGIPVVATVAITLVVVVGGALTLAALTSSETAQGWGLFVLIACAPVPSWLLERRARTRHETHAIAASGEPTSG